MRSAHGAFAVPESETAGPSPTLRSPGFPVEVGGAGGLHAAFRNESSTRGSVRRCVAGNPGPVGMTNLRVAADLGSGGGGGTESNNEVPHLPKSQFGQVRPVVVPSCPLCPAPSHPRRLGRRISFARPGLGLAAIATVVVLFYVRTHLRTEPHRFSRRHRSPCKLALSNRWTFGRVHARASLSHPPGRWHNPRRKCDCPPLRRRSGRWCLSEICPSALPGQSRRQG